MITYAIASAHLVAQILKVHHCNCHKEAQTLSISFPKATKANSAIYQMKTSGSQNYVQASSLHFNFAQPTEQITPCNI